MERRSEADEHGDTRRESRRAWGSLCRLRTQGRALVGIQGGVLHTHQGPTAPSQVLKECNTGIKQKGLSFGKDGQRSGGGGGSVGAVR